MQEPSSFWTDIKTLEDQLAKTPDSFCFARLAEVYLKVGLVDDALHVARQGSGKHPGYLSGLRVLAQACHAKGLSGEAIAALQLVADALPEDVASQKLLGQLLVGSGDSQGACRAFSTALEFAPDDVESRIELESLQRTMGGATGLAAISLSDEFELEELDILDDLEIVDEDESEFVAESASKLPLAADESAAFLQPVEAAPLSSSHDPLSTSTLAELYVQQGFIHKALEIYRAKLADNPLDQAVAVRISELELLDAAPVEAISYDDDVEDEDMGTGIHEAESFAADLPEPAQEVVAEFIPEPAVAAPVVAEQLFAGFSNSEAAAAQVPRHGTADEAVATLEGWLENIRRIKSCR
jgi:tetratricopeptide (TPR) repeat protein